MRWDVYFLLCAVCAITALILVQQHRKMVVALAASGAVPMTMVRTRKPAVLYKLPTMRMARNPSGSWDDTGDDNGNG